MTSSEVTVCVICWPDRAGGGYARRVPEPGGQEERVPGAPGVQNPPAGHVPVRRGQLADRRAPEPGHPALGVGEHGGPAAERLGHLGLAEPGGRGQVRRCDGAASGEERVQGDGEPLPGRVQIPQGGGDRLGQLVQGRALLFLSEPAAVRPGR